MSLLFRNYGHYLVVFGNTFPVREQIKALGGRFDGAGRTWRIPVAGDTLKRVQALCESFGGGMVEGDPDVSVVATANSASVAGSAQQQGILATGNLTTGILTTGILNTTQPQPTQSTYTVFTVRQLMDQAATVVARAFPNALWIMGEIQNLSQRASGLFFELAEARDEQTSAPTQSSATLTVRGIIWRDALERIMAQRGKDEVTHALQDGLKIALLCRVQFYRDRGQLSLVIDDIDPAYTKGALALAREKLLKELRVKGLDRANKALELSPFPFRVGLMSADNSRAKSDFIDQLAVLGFPGEVIFCPTPMQGDAVPKAVASGLKRLAKRGCDVIVITRGGGSASDLRWFDDPLVAYAIAESPVPIVAAIGHHEDVCVAEEIAFMRQKTPTAAADFIIACFVATRERIEVAAGKMARGLGLRVAGFAEETAALSERLAQAADRSLDRRQLGLKEYVHRLERVALHLVMRETQVANSLRLTLETAVHKSLSHYQEKIADLHRQLTRMDPMPWLNDGWTRLTISGGGRLISVQQATVGTEVSARLKDGNVKLIVT